MFPTSNDLQYARERNEFVSDPDITTVEWPEAIGFEPTYESTNAGIDQIEAYANDPSNHEAADAAIATSTLEAQRIAMPTPVEQQQSRERDIYAARIISHVGQLDRYNRDYVRSEEPAEQPENHGFFKSKGQKHAARVARMSERQLIQAESEIGKTLFGPVDKGSRREFFNLDEDTWIWHEEWADGSGKKQLRTTRYEVRGDEIIKSQDGERRTYVTGDELQNLMMATRLYYDRVTRAVYHRDPTTGRKLVDIL